MHHKDFPDIQEILDQVFSAAEEIRNAVANEMGLGQGPYVNWMDHKDYYPAYAYPPLNVFMTADRSMVFQIALAGFSEKDISLEFRGDYLVFSAKVSDNFEQNDVRYFKRRLKFKSIGEQKYYVPADKFNQEAVRAIMRNAILTITVPPKDGAKESDGRPINIVREDEASSAEAEA